MLCILTHLFSRCHQPPLIPHFSQRKRGGEGGGTADKKINEGVHTDVVEFEHGGTVHIRSCERVVTRSHHYVFPRAHRVKETLENVRAGLGEARADPKKEKIS
jgi:hypothetical protein